jgi:hypothetical protein
MPTRAVTRPTATPATTATPTTQPRTDARQQTVGNAAVQERVKRFDVFARGLPRKCLLAQHHSCGETGAESDHEAARCHSLDGGDS